MATATTLSFFPKFCAYDDNGNPLTGGLLYSYAAGGSTPIDTYTDATGGTANSNPVQLDTAGRADVWLSPTSSYKFVLKNSAGTTLWTVDGINPAGLMVSSLTILNATAIPAGGTAGSGYKFSTTANFGVFFGSGAPSLSAAKGSLYLRSDGTTTNNRAYINSDGATTWTALTTAA